ncbi:unnamed protein product, partial [marine sediment metagenome]
ISKEKARLDLSGLISSVKLFHLSQFGHLPNHLIELYPQF